MMANLSIIRNDDSDDDNNVQFLQNGLPMKDVDPYFQSGPPQQISYTSRTGFESAQSLSPGFVK